MTKSPLERLAEIARIFKRAKRRSNWKPKDYDALTREDFERIEALARTEKEKSE